MERVDEVIDGVDVCTFEEDGQIVVEYTNGDRVARTVIERDTYYSMLKFNHDAIDNAKVATIAIIKEVE